MRDLYRNNIGFCIALVIALFCSTIAFSQNKVGIGTNTPSEKLHVVGNLKVDTIKPSALQLLPNAASGKLLISNATGVAAWDSVDHVAWSIQGNSATPSQFIGTTNAQPLRFKIYNIQAGEISDTNLFNTSLGFRSLMNNSNGAYNLAFGSSALAKNISGNFNTGIGAFALQSNLLGEKNVAIGANALYKNKSNHNIALGYASLFNDSTGARNIGIGSNTLFFGHNPERNIAIGFTAGQFISATDNVVVGDNSGQALSLGSKNVVFGNNAEVLDKHMSGAIGYGAYSAQDSVIAIGNASHKVAIARMTADEKLHVAGNIKADSLAGSGSRILFADAQGKIFDSVLTLSGGPADNWGTQVVQTNATLQGNGTIAQPLGLAQQGAIVGQVLRWSGSAWVPQNDSISSAWKTAGNAGTNPAVNFIGTSDNTDFRFKRFNTNAGRVSTNNTAFGLLALADTTTGTNNTALGVYALRFNGFGINNTAVGYSSLMTNSSGYGNSALGLNALRDNSIGIFNTATGQQALQSNTTGNYNVASGLQALFSNLSGEGNTAMGVNAMYSNSTASYNTANGNSALYYNTTGNNNSAIGYLASFKNTSGSGNVANGFQALYNTSIGNNNVGVGLSSGYNNRNGSNNVFVGVGADAIDTNMVNSTAIGYNAKVGINNALVLGDSINIKVGIGTAYPTRKLDVRGTFRLSDGTQANGRVLSTDAVGNASWQPATNFAWGVSGNAGLGPANFIGTTDNVDLRFKRGGVAAGYLGSDNTAFGYACLGNNNGGYWNNAYGVQALALNIGGNFNNAFGTSAMYYNTYGIGNTAFGHDALAFTDSSDYNTALGDEAGTVLASEVGDGNTFLGAFSTYNFGCINCNFSTALGYASVITASNQVRVGNSGTSSIGGFANWTNVSDKRLKRNIAYNTVPGLAFIKKLKPVTYNLDMYAIAKFYGKSDSAAQAASRDDKAKVLQSGFLAQEVEQAAAELGYSFSGVDQPQNENDMYGLRYAEFVVPLVKAVQELDEKVRDMQVNEALLLQQNELLKKEIEILKSHQTH